MALFVVAECFQPLSRGLAGQVAGADFLEIKTSARVAALGEAFVSLADDASSLQWNPAGLGLLDRALIEFNHVEYFIDTRFEHLALAFPAGKIGALGLGLSFSTVDDLFDTDEFGFSQPVAAYDFVGILSYARQISPGFSLGLSPKFYTSYLVGSRASGFAVDLGVLYQILDPLRAGVSLMNLGPDIVYEEIGDPLPSWFKFGLTGFLIQGGDYDFLVSVEANLPFLHEGIPHFNSGAEWTLLHSFFLRLGYSSESEGGRITYGLGLKFGNLGFNYAFVPFGLVGNSHNISLQAALGKKKVQEKQTREAVLPTVLDLLALGDGHIREQAFSKALEAYKTALERAPSDAAIWRRIGNARLRLGQWQEGIGALEESLRLNPGDKELADWLKNAKSMAPNPE